MKVRLLPVIAVVAEEVSDVVVEIGATVLTVTVTVGDVLPIKFVSPP